MYEYICTDKYSIIAYEITVIHINKTKKIKKFNNYTFPYGLQRLLQYSLHI